MIITIIRFFVMCCLNVVVIMLGMAFVVLKSQLSFSLFVYILYVFICYGSLSFISLSSFRTDFVELYIDPRHQGSHPTTTGIGGGDGG